VVEGPQFTAPAPVALWAGWDLFSSRPAVFLYGLLAAAGGMWFSRNLWNPKPPPVRPPRVLRAGPGAAFSSISDALAAARPGDTVEVLAGEYSEQVRLKSGVNLRTRDAILRAAPMSNGPAVIAENVRNARVTGLRIIGGGQAPLSAGIVLADSDVQLEDADVDGAGVGIEIRGAGSPVLRGNSVHDSSGAGILITGPSEPLISHNTLRGNKTGLAAHDGARPALEGNLFDKNSIQVELPAEMPMKDVRAHNTFIDAKPAGGKKP
jgi:parallel beta-helix repeat protein